MIKRYRIFLLLLLAALGLAIGYRVRHPAPAWDRDRAFGIEPSSAGS